MLYKAAEKRAEALRATAFNLYSALDSIRGAETAKMAVRSRCYLSILFCVSF